MRERERERMKYKNKFRSVCDSYITFCTHLSVVPVKVGVFV